MVLKRCQRFTQKLARVCTANVIRAISYNRPIDIDMALSDVCMRKRSLFFHFQYANDHFIKTGSGQTYGQSSSKMMTENDDQNDLFCPRSETDDESTKTGSGQT
jgi:hypothetical protein